MKNIFIPLIICLFPVNMLLGQSPTELPLFTISDMVYEGAFRVDATTYGPSSINYAQGPIAYDSENNSVFMVGHAHHQAIAEFTVPALVNSTTLADLNMAMNPIQEYTEVLDRTPDGNPEGIDRVGGLYCVDDSGQQKLIVNAYEYYDAPGNNSLTTIIADDADDLLNCSVEGYLEFQGGAGHTSGWISEIPSEWQSLLEGTHITGQSSGIPIISRCSVGPSAFSFFMNDLLAGTSPIPTTTLLDFSLSNPLHDDLHNDDLDNDLWTHLSRVTYGFIIPNTRTYFTIGDSGGHVSGVCYKCTQDDGNLCGGYCPPQADDEYQHYWLWDLKDLLDVKNGIVQPHEVRPYEYGQFTTPFQTEQRDIGGGSFDPESGLLYLNVLRADTEQGTYARPPVVVVYNMEALILPSELSMFTATVVEDSVHLEWVTSSEQNNKGFDIEHSLDGINWETLGFVSGHGTSTSEQHYNYIHELPNRGKNYYRLKQLDFDQNHSYSPTKGVLISGIERFSITPNPTSGQVMISGPNYEKLWIIDTWGRILLTENQSLTQLDLSEFPPGSYFIHLKSNTKSFFKKVIKY